MAFKMKLLTRIFFPSFLLLFAANGQDEYTIAQTQQDEVSQRRMDQYKSLFLAKKFILSGNIPLARYYLDKIHPEDSPLNLVIRRYQAIIALIEDDYQRSLERISPNEYILEKNYRQICFLRLIGMLALDHKKHFEREFFKCSKKTIDHSPNEFFWMRKIWDFKQHKFYPKSEKQIGNILTNTAYSKLWFKLLLYSGQESLLPEYLAMLPSFAYQSKELREIIGMMYYRLGKDSKALDFIEDINTPNTDNIRGNVALEKRDYESALKHFQNALEKKENSKNALERAIPLAWLTKQWDAGLKLLFYVLENTQNFKQKLSLDSAFKIRKNDFENARKQIILLGKLFEGKVPIEVDLMESYVALRRMDLRTMRISSAQACHRFDGLNCWQSLQLVQWENFGELAKRDDEVFSFADFNPEDYKAPVAATPLREVVRIRQQDLEELDSGIFSPL